MAWNEPGGGRDPWGGKSGDGPPDLDEALRKVRENFNKLFGGKGGSKGGGAMVVVVLVILLALWAGIGIYQVDAKEQAVLLRFGKYYETVGPGLHWNPPLIDTVVIVGVTEARSYTAKGLMLTEDVNIVEVPVTVQYTVPDAKAFVLNVRRPEVSLHHAVDSAIRHVVGSTKAADVLSEGRQKLAGEVKDRLQQYLDNYGTGISITVVNIGKAQPPSAVKAAFDDVIASKEDKDRYVKEAEGYRNGIVPEARGQAQRIIQDATAYREKVIAEAQGEAERFEKLLVAYEKAPDVTRQRLYLDTVQQVMGNASKVLVDVEGGNNMLYLPLDRLMESQPKVSSPAVQNIDKVELRDMVQDVIDEMRREQNNSRRRETR